MIRHLLSMVLPLFLLLSITSCKESNKVNSAPSEGEVSEWQDVTIDQALQVEDAILLDVRTPGEVAEGIIPGALHIDVKNSNFKVEVDKLDKSKTYMVYCRSGGRSKTASDIMVDLGFENVNNVLGGYSGYMDSKHSPTSNH